MESVIRIPARCDYAIRAMLELAAAGGANVKAVRISQAQAIPIPFLENIMTQLRRGGLVYSQRGFNGGHRLASPAETITLAQVINAVAVPSPRRPRRQVAENATVDSLAAPLQDVWAALGKNVHDLLETITLAELIRKHPRPSQRKASARLPSRAGK